MSGAAQSQVTSGPLKAAHSILIMAPDQGIANPKEFAHCLIMMHHSVRRFNSPLQECRTILAYT